MRTRKSLLTVAALAAALAAPSGALAQSAGDDQYTDPFGETEQPAQGQQQEPEAPAPAEPAPQADTSGQEQVQAAPAQEAPAQLPRTGFAAVLAAAWGFALLLGGFAIRRSV